MLSRRNRLYLAILLAFLVGVALLMWRLLADIDPRYRESAEESLVETTHLLAALVEQGSQDGQAGLDTRALERLFTDLQARRFEADIFGFVKTRVELQAVVVDRQGRVVFDSTGRALGADFSPWRDVRLALAGRYGARTTIDADAYGRAAVMHVAVPIRLNGEVVGAVAAGKPMRSLGQFVDAARRKTVLVGLGSAFAVLALALIGMIWLLRPLSIVRGYIAHVRAEGRFSLPRMLRRAWSALGLAYDEVRDTLAGRNHVADHVQTLTHELKSPLSAIRGAAELLREPMPAADHARFVANIERETGRIQDLVDRMMELVALESRLQIDSPQPVALRPLLQEQLASAAAAAAARGVRLRLEVHAEAWVLGDALLLGRAVANLVDNALAFSPRGGEVCLGLHRVRQMAEIRVSDQGPGVPAFALDKVFDKFFSLPRPDTQRRSTGLGLAFVKEVAALHHGRIRLRNAEPPGDAPADQGAPARPGAVATLSLPLSGPGGAA